VDIHARARLSALLWLRLQTNLPLPLKDTRFTTILSSFGKRNDKRQIWCLFQKYISIDIKRKVIKNGKNYWY
jgi:hypothetical protein